MDKDKSESVIDGESSTEESKGINTNKEKYAIEKTEHEEPSVTDNPVTNKPSYFNLFKCGKNLLNRLEVMCERACIATSRDRYYTEIYKTLTDNNYCNNTPLSNEKIREAIRKVTEEESILDANNVTADTFSHTSNTQRENSNAIFTIEKMDKLDDLADALKDLTINDAGYYE